MAWWAEGGVFMYIVTASAALTGLGVGIAFLLSVAAWFVRALRVPARILGILSVLATPLPLVVGVAGWMYSRSVVDAALLSVDPAQADMIREVGYAEARHVLDLGSGLTCLLVAGAAVGALIALSVPAPPQDDEG
jgi:hypothetical protein